MERLIALLISVITILFVCVKCSDSRPSGKTSNGETHGTKLIELTIDNKTHEFVVYRSDPFENNSTGIAHWPDCKYCKFKTNDKE